MVEYDHENTLRIEPWEPLLKEFKVELERRTKERDRNAQVVLHLEKGYAMITLFLTRNYERYIIAEQSDRRLFVHPQIDVGTH